MYMFVFLVRTFCDPGSKRGAIPTNFLFFIVFYLPDTKNAISKKTEIQSINVL